MKKTVAILLSVFLMALVGCSENNDTALSELEIELITSNNISMEANSMGFDEADEPYITASIKNKSDYHTIIYGQQFLIFEGAKRVNPNGIATWNDIAYILKAGDENTVTFKLGDYDLKDNVTYRIVKQYSIEGYRDKYSMYFDFKIDR